MPKRLQLSGLAIISRKTSFLACEFASPPVLVSLRLLDDFDPVALPERQVAGALAREIVLRDHILLWLATAYALRWGRWWLFLGRNAGLRKV